MLITQKKQLLIHNLGTIMSMGQKRESIWVTEQIHQYFSNKPVLNIVTYHHSGNKNVRERIIQQ